MRFEAKLVRRNGPAVPVVLVNKLLKVLKNGGKCGFCDNIFGYLRCGDAP
jgi:hypothetical protein